MVGQSPFNSLIKMLVKWVRNTYGPYVSSCYEVFLPSILTELWSHHFVLALLNSVTRAKTAVFYISSILLDRQYALCFLHLPFHKNLTKYRSKPSTNAASTKYNRFLYFSELNENSLFVFGFCNR